MAKMFEDTFRSFGILKDDSPKYVAKTNIEVVIVSHPKGAKIDKKNMDWVDIVISPFVSQVGSTAYPEFKEVEHITKTN
jgi:hypothetical protein